MILETSKQSRESLRIMKQLDKSDAVSKTDSLIEALIVVSRYILEPPKTDKVER
jgi:hypothetical protein